MATIITVCGAEDCKHNSDGACTQQEVQLDGDFQCESFEGKEEE